jgi:hypothetical protein
MVIRITTLGKDRARDMNFRVIRVTTLGKEGKMIIRFIRVTGVTRVIILEKERERDMIIRFIWVVGVITLEKERRGLLGL